MQWPSGHTKAVGELNPAVFHFLWAARYPSSSVIDLNLHDPCDSGGYGRSGPQAPYGASSGELCRSLLARRMPAFGVGKLPVNRSPVWKELGPDRKPLQTHVSGCGAWRVFRWRSRQEVRVGSSHSRSNAW